MTEWKEGMKEGREGGRKEGRKRGKDERKEGKNKRREAEEVIRVLPQMFTCPTVFPSQPRPTSVEARKQER